MKIKTLKHYNNKASYEEIINLSTLELIFFHDLESVSKTISDYFINNINKSVKGNRLGLSLPNGDNSTIKLNQHIAFGIKLNSFSGSKITTKLKQIFIQKAVLKKLIEIQKIYKEVYFFSKSNSSYVTDIALNNFKKKKEQNRSYFNNAIVLSSSGKPVRLSKLIPENNLCSSVFSNTSKELIALAQKTNKSWLTATITCPSIFHINPCSKQKSWDGKITPLQANEFQNKIWEDTLRKLGKLKISPFGFWVKEPNKSGAIHRHLIIYAHSTELLLVDKWLRHYTKSAFKKLNCKYTSNKAIEIKCGDANEISKVKKITKYLCKNIKAYKDKCSSSKTNEKHAAHAYIYKYRRFGFIGLKKSLGLWKLLKELSNQTEKHVPTELQKLVYLAKNNEFHKFILSPYRAKLSALKDSYPNLKSKVIGLTYDDKDIVFKGRFVNLFKQIISYLKLSMFFMIKNPNYSF